MATIALESKQESEESEQEEDSLAVPSSRDSEYSETNFSTASSSNSSKTRKKCGRRSAWRETDVTDMAGVICSNEKGRKLQILD